MKMSETDRSGDEQSMVTDSRLLLSSPKDNPINTHRYKFIIAIIIATTRHITSTAYYTYPPGVALAM